MIKYVCSFEQMGKKKRTLAARKLGLIVTLRGEKKLRSRPESHRRNSLHHKKRRSSPGGFLYQMLWGSFRSYCSYFTWHFQCKMVSTTLGPFEHWILHLANRGFGSGVALQLQQKVPQEPLAPKLCLLQGDSMERKEPLSAGEDVSSLEICWGGTTGLLV